MQTANHIDPPTPQDRRRTYRIERRFCGERHAREVVQSLLRAHL